MLAHDQNLGFGNFATKNSCYFQSIHSRHADIQENEIGKQFASFPNRFFSILRLAADFPSCFRRQNIEDAAPNVFVVIHNQNPHVLANAVSRLA